MSYRGFYDICTYAYPLPFTVIYLPSATLEKKKKKTFEEYFHVWGGKFNICGLDHFASEPFNYHNS